MEGNFDDASRLIAASDPEQSISLLSSLLQNSGSTRGEEAMIISLNLRWYPDFINQKQLARLEPISYNFQPTQHDRLAQAPGRYSFFVDDEGVFWQGLGEVEISNAEARAVNTSSRKTNDQWISTDTSLVLSLKTWRGQPLTAGKYRAIIQFRDAPSEELTIKINSSEELAYKLVRGSEYPFLELEFTASGEAMHLELNPHGSGISPTRLQIIPLP
jgi:hypothetical protein